MPADLLAFKIDVHGRRLKEALAGILMAYHGHAEALGAGFVSKR